MVRFTRITRLFNQSDRTMALIVIFPPFTHPSETIEIPPGAYREVRYKSYFNRNVNPERVPNLWIYSYVNGEIESGSIGCLLTPEQLRDNEDIILYLNDRTVHAQLFGRTFISRMRGYMY